MQGKEKQKRKEEERMNKKMRNKERESGKRQIEKGRRGEEGIPGVHDVVASSSSSCSCSQSVSHLSSPVLSSLESKTLSS